MDGTSLFLVNRFELNCLIGILSSAGGTSTVEVFLDVVPAETTDLHSVVSSKRKQ